MELAEPGLEPMLDRVGILVGNDEFTDRGATVRSAVLNRSVLPRILPYALVLIAGALFVPAPVHGLTLGNVASLSALGQPLRVVIPVLLSSNETLNIACVKLVADNSAAGTPQIVTGRVSFEDGSNNPRLVISLPTAVNEPALRLAVQAGCGSTTRRDYVLLLDPPGNEASTVLASADIDEPSWTRVTRERVAAAPALPRTAVAVASPLPPTKWGTPVPTAAPIVEALPKTPEKVVPEPAPTAVAAVTVPAPPRELITVSSGSTSGGFISEAGASPLPSRAPTMQVASSQSLPLTQPSWRTQQTTPAPSVWQLTWPYAAVIFGTLSLGLVASFLHRRHSIRTSWMDPSALESLKGETQAGPPQVTFAHFASMAESVPTASRASLKLPAADLATEVTELDTLLQDIQSDMIDERTIKEAWKSAAGDSPLDMGSDSILKAIAAAERDLQIGAPEPAQVALDNALENELMTIPNIPKSVRFG
jgi:hypothetical protein